MKEHILVIAGVLIKEVACFRTDRSSVFGVGKKKGLKTKN